MGGLSDLDGGSALDPGPACPDETATGPSAGQLEEHAAGQGTAVAMTPRRFKRPQSVLVLVCTSGGEFLMLRRASPADFWQSVTGSLDLGESPRLAALRELREETGLDLPVEPLGYRHAFALDPAVLGRPPGELRTAEETAFAARGPPGARARLSAEHVELEWVAPAEAAGRLRFAGLRRALRLAAGGDRRP